MYRLASGARIAYEVTPLDGRPFYYLAAHLCENPQGVRDVIIALNVPEWVPRAGERVILLGEDEVARLFALLEDEPHCLDFYSFLETRLGDMDERYTPGWVVYIPGRLVPRRVREWGRPFIREDGAVFLAAYNSANNVLFVTDFVHNIPEEERPGAARKLVGFLRDVGVPIPDEPVGGGLHSVARFPEVTITFGADPEFELVRGRRIVRASGAVPRGEVQLPWGAIGVDGAGDPLELRPAPATTPRELVDNVGRLLLSVPKLIGGVPSTMCEMYPIGGHLHIGFDTPAVRRYDENIVKAIDGELGAVFFSLNSRRRLESYYGRRGDWRTQEWGVEYRTPPAAIWCHPEVALAFLEGVAHVVNALVREGEWDPARDPAWGEIKERVRKAAEFVKKYGGRLHWGAWKEWVGDFHLAHESGVEVEFVASAEKDGAFLDDLRLMLIRLGLPRVRVLPLRKARGDYASNVRGYGVLVDGVSGFVPDLTLALSWRFRNDPAFRREELPKLEAAIARLLDGDGDDGNRLIKEAIPLDGDWPDVPTPDNSVEFASEDEEEADEEDTFVCDECGYTFPDGDLCRSASGEMLCPDCYNEIYTDCYACGREVARDDAAYYEDGIYCPSCYEEHFGTCDECEEDYPRSDLHVIVVREGESEEYDWVVCEGCLSMDFEYNEEEGVYHRRE